MIVNISEKNLTNKVGNKAKFLSIMKNNGFNVPNGIILDSETFDEIIRKNNKSNVINEVIQNITRKNVKEKSKKLQKIIEKIVIPDEILMEIEKNCDADKKYAVRSSGTKEDLEHFSFAGQYDTFLNVLGNRKEIAKAIIKCYQSMYSEVILSYLINNGIPIKDLKMSVIIQEMVDSEISGIAFTVNPTTGIDKEIVVEVTQGLGENIVSGKVKPERYIYNWYEDKYENTEDNKLLTEDMLKNIMDTALKIQEFFGYPCDIEFAFNDSKLYILQARAITKIKYAKIQDIWSTADFKDGGVSASVCTPYMWSLYEYIWEFTLRKFILDSKILKEKEMNRKLGDMFYGRPYWNMSVVKLGMSKVPGYKEREFDSEFGVKIIYEGDGHTTKITPKSIIGIIKIAIEQNKILKERNENAENYKKDLLNKYDNYIKIYNDEDTFKQIEKKWYKLTKRDYLQSEATYFWQIFINTIHQSLYKDSLLKYVTESEYLSLLSGINDISHLLPFYDMWNITREIREDKNKYKLWKDNTIQELCKMLNEKKSSLKEVEEFIEKYGYHSNKELDVTYPCYYEDVETVIKMFKDTIELEDSYSPINDQEKQKQEYEKQLEKIKTKVNEKSYKKIYNKIQGMRKMLWWREEFRDISTRFYYIIRIYTMKLAKYYVDNKILKEENDIWYLKVGDIWDFIDKKIDQKELERIIERNKKYYNSFRNFMSENEIGSIFDEESKEKAQRKNGIYGIGCNNGKVTATARVIEDIEQIDRIQKGDILITKFTDTGWTCKFAMLSGIVTEYGGILCHAAIVSREYGIPCIVCANDIMKKIKDGQKITIDGTTGEINIKKE